MSKTPQFDKALDEILKDLKPHQKTCKNCGENFEIFAEDIEMYHKFRVPPPTLCPLCRMQRRMALYPRLSPFFRKSCSAPGHSEKVISLYAESSPVKIYDNAYYRSDKWDAFDFGFPLEIEKPFFDQFRELFLKVPQQALFVDPQSVNSEYSIGGIAGKNCYYVAAPLYSENILYAWAPIHTLDSMDVTQVSNSELLYWCMNCQKSFNCNFCLDSVGCRDSWFLYDCRNCNNCFMSSNLRNKSYYFFNEQLSKTAYDEKINSLNLGRRKTIEELKEKFEILWKEAIHKYLHGEKAVNSSGDYIFDCRNCFESFGTTGNCEDFRYVQYSVNNCKDAVDASGIGEFSQKVYESAGIGSSSFILFSANLRQCSFMEYSVYCRNSNYCFGSVGLKDKKFFVFNQQYEENEYWEKVDEIKTLMLFRGEYGELFPIKYGAVSYYNTMAYIEMPLGKEASFGEGIPWYEDEEKYPPEIKFLQSQEVPDDIRDVRDDILNKAIFCEKTGRPFRVIKQELEFYRKKGLPLPVRHPDQRLRERFDKINRFRLWQYPCSKCGKVMNTSYNPSKKLKVYCEECYQKEIL